MDEVDILIIGGGAAGLMAACSIAGSGKAAGLSVSLLERQEKAGRKILASGNGRCNLGNSGSLKGHYRGIDPDFVLPVFNAVDQTEYREVFLNLGLPLFEDEAGRQYPRTLRSDTVHSALLNALSAGNITVKYGLEVYDIERGSGSSEDEFIVSFRGRENNSRSGGRLEEGYIKAKTVIIATGGKSQPQLGGHDSGYALAEALGHSRTELFPALVPIELADAGQWRRGSGQRIRASACYRSHGGKMSAPVDGEFLFTDYGVSGIAAMELAEAVERDQNQR
ncbi:MAG: aminoacetone oxidase family FAD-binding enzyme, partial [Clostridiaceae bacterium]|nr:aminoacetone oxidase family FAD-binding enzyme [Clostridiaceae bacterium]